MTDSIRGKKFVIVGGSSGIGMGVAKALVLAGAGEVIIASSSQEKVNNAVEKLKLSVGSNSVNVVGKVLDLNNASELKPFFDFVGKYDHLVISAGSVGAGAGFPNVDINTARSGAETRFWSVLEMIKISHENISKGGSITLTSGTTVIRPMKGWSVISGLAGAVETMTRNLAIDMAPIRVNCIAPGVVDTELWAHFDSDTKKGMFEHYKNTLPVGHVGTPEEVAEAYLFCFRCNYITGQTLFIDGGGMLV